MRRVYVERFEKCQTVNLVFYLEYTTKHVLINAISDIFIGVSSARIYLLNAVWEDGLKYSVPLISKKISSR